MTVYVESNSVLAIAPGQEDAEAATTILELAEQGRIAVAFPALALTEPFSTVTHRGRVRRQVSGLLNDQIRELRRSTPHQDIVDTLQAIPVALVDLEKREIDLLEATVRRLLVVGRSIPLDELVFARALSDQSRFDLSPQDAIIFASVISDLSGMSQSRHSLFISKNWKDFGDPGITADLRSSKLRLCGKLPDGVESRQWVVARFVTTAECDRPAPCPQVCFLC